MLIKDIMIEFIKSRLKNWSHIFKSDEIHNSIIMNSQGNIPHRDELYGRSTEKAKIQVHSRALPSQSLLNTRMSCSLPLAFYLYSTAIVTNSATSAMTASIQLSTTNRLIL